MMKYLKEHEQYLLILLKSEGKKTDWQNVLVNHRAVICNLQHERLIHLLVTLTFGLAFIIFMMFTLIFQFNLLMIFDVLTLVLLVPYIFYYYQLENGVQRLYRLDKEIVLILD